MAKIVIHECDRCLKRFTSDVPPQLWKKAAVVNALLEPSPQQRGAVIRLWCEDCWREIFTAIPQAAKPTTK